MLPKQRNLPFTMIPSLVHKASHSSMLQETPGRAQVRGVSRLTVLRQVGAHLCDVSTTERPVLMMSRTRFQRNLRALGSIPVVGSSCTRPQDSQPGVHLQGRAAGEDGHHGNTKVTSYQEDERGIADESDGRGQPALVPPAVGPRWAVGIRGQLQLLQSPLDHLRRWRGERRAERRERRRGAIRQQLAGAGMWEEPLTLCWSLQGTPLRRV